MSAPPVPLDALNAVSTQLQVSDGAGGWVTIAKVLDISGPGLTANVEDVTARDSPGGWTQKLPTTLEAGDVTFDIFWIPDEPTHATTGEAGLVADLVARTKRIYRVVWPEERETWEFDAYVTGFVPSAPIQGALRASVTLSLDGAPAFAPLEEGSGNGGS
jgi:hypothetical protein